MRTFASRIIVVLTMLVLWPIATSAQTSAIAGTVKDASGAILPGVTVEVSSPALIEKTRSATTYGAGRYKIIELRPGMYSVTFTLAGFNVVRRENLYEQALTLAPNHFARHHYLTHAYENTGRLLATSYQYVGRVSRPITGATGRRLGRSSRWP